MYEINRFRRLSQALVHFVIDRASLFTDCEVGEIVQGDEGPIGEVAQVVCHGVIV